MNIFWLDTNEYLAAKYHCDKHVVKMCVEYAQLLSGVVRINSPELCTDTFPYRLTHKNHPCAIWARDNIGHYVVLYTLACFLGEEYTRRYGKQHKSIEEVVKKLPHWNKINFPSPYLFTQPPQCMPEQYRVADDIVTAYRNYYIGEKSRFATWKSPATKPSWFTA